MIKRIYIHNYKCFSNFSFRPEEPSPLMIIGRNGVGKSSFCKVLMLLRDYAEGRDLSAYFTKEELSLFAPQAPVEIEAEIEVEGVSHSLRLVFQPDAHAPQGHRMLESRLDDAAREVLKTIEVVRPEPERMTSLVGGAESGLHLEPSCANVATWFAVQGGSDPSLRAAFISSLALTFEDFTGYSYESREDGQHLKCHFRPENMNEAVLDFEQLSDGEKCRFLASAISVVNSRLQAIILFWDEPDNYITTSEEAALFYALGHAFQGRGQLLMASHSELGILTLNDHETYVFDRRNHASPVLPPQNLAELRKSGELSGSLQAALVSGGISL